MSDKIAEIRARHEINDRYRGWHPGAHKDRAALLAEVERLQGLLNGFSRDMVEEIERLTRELNEARAEVERLREVIRTIRARCVELDDSDAVSEVLDISSAALGDEA
jgi:hypothetical protein